MSTRKTVGSFIKHIGEVLNLGLEMNDDGICAFEGKNGILYVIESPEEGELFHLYCAIAEIPQDKDLALDLMSRALELNMFQIATHGGSLAFSTELGQIMFCFSSPIEGCDEVMFANVVQNFIQTATELKEDLEAKLPTNELE